MCTLCSCEVRGHGKLTEFTTASKLSGAPTVSYTAASGEKAQLSPVTRASVTFAQRHSHAKMGAGWQTDYNLRACQEHANSKLFSLYRTDEKWHHYFFVFFIEYECHSQRWMNHPLFTPWKSESKAILSAFCAHNVKGKVNFEVQSACFHVFKLLLRIDVCVAWVCLVSLMTDSCSVRPWLKGLHR